MTSMFSLLAATQEYAINAPLEPTGIAPSMSFSDMGVVRWPITFCALMVMILAARAAWRMKQGGAEHNALARNAIDGSLFWGLYAFALGVLGTVVGIVLAAQAIEGVGRVEPPLVWGGVKVALMATIHGLLVFLVAALVWFGLRQWHRRSVLSGA